MMKKLFIFLLLVIVSFNTSIHTQAAGTGTLTVSNAEVGVGNSVIVDISITENPGIVAMKLSLNYNSDVLKLISVENGKVFSKETFVSGKELTAVPFGVLWEDSLSKVNNTSTGKLVSFKFQALEGVESGNYPVTISYDTGSTFDVNLDNVEFHVTNGNITITNPDKPVSNSSCTHKNTDWIIAKEPTCTETGTKENHCSSCDQIVETAYISAKGHEMGEWKSSQDTLTQERFCNVCSYKERESISQAADDKSDSEEAESNIMDGDNDNKSEVTENPVENIPDSPDILEEDASAQVEGALLDNASENKDNPKMNQENILYVILGVIIVTGAIVFLVKRKKVD